ncbi:radical sam [Lucifera butyrica]|uniref:Radical sam n=1 Tax=Lucifera butyrica TaxID=1351585 RepID=A0A498R620_9FIRM|nr:radical SAM protein [Lucifera butyrica]VBB05653.1 radical sam [Lucifera butyrica]
MKHYIIPIFIPHYGCRHQCIFCNQKKITGRETPVAARDVADIIDKQLASINQERHIEVAFYGGSFTALPLNLQKELLSPAWERLQLGKIRTLRVSTRPDCIDAAILENLKQFGVSIVELGVQSLDNEVLRQSARGHLASHVTAAVSQIKAKGLLCGIQLMPGLPGETRLSLMETACKVIQLRPDFIRIYPTLVIADTKLARLYSEGRFQPLSLNEAVRQAAFLKLVFERQGIRVIRTGLQTTAELCSPGVVLAGPFHPAFGEMVESYLFYLMIVRFLESTPVLPRFFSIHHYPQDHSKLRGVAGQNLRRWKEEYGIVQIRFIADGEQKNELRIEWQAHQYIINKEMIFL